MAAALTLAQPCGVCGNWAGSSGVGGRSVLQPLPQMSSGRRSLACLPPERMDKTDPGLGEQAAGSWSSRWRSFRGREVSVGPKASFHGASSRGRALESWRWPPVLTRLPFAAEENEGQ